MKSPPLRAGSAPPDAVFDAVRDVDPDVLDSSELATHLERIAQLRAWCDAQQVRATRRQRALAREGRATAPENALSRNGRQSAKDAAAAADREAICTAMPGFEDALANGDVAAGHVDAVASATRKLDEQEAAEFAAEAANLLADATRQGVDEFAKGCRRLAKRIRADHNSRSDVDELEQQRAQSKVTRWVDQVTGMHHTHIECDPLTDRQVWAAVQHTRGELRQRNQRTNGSKQAWDRLTVDAFVEAVTSDHSAKGGALVVHIDVDHLTDGSGSLCETDSGVAVPVDTARRVACDAEIIPVVLNGAGVVLDEGRGKRLATREQRLAIQAMQATCSHPDCTVSVDDCRIHHVNPWQRGGSTNLDRLAPLCEPHHHLVHEGGWEFTMTSDRNAIWRQPDGETYWSGPLNDRRAASA